VRPNLKKLRKNKGLTLKQLSEKSGLGLSTLGNFETGRYDMSPGNLEKLAEVLEVSVQEILENPPAPTPYPDDHSGYGVQILKDAEKPITAADFAETKERIKTLEEKLDRLLKHLGATP
jgi:transcriptional regulator with XRE-family HTH domain